MRVPFPDSSAVEPSGFQITTSASSSAAGHLDDAVGVAHLGAHAVRRQPALVSEQVDVPVRVPASRISSATSSAGLAASTLIRSGIFRIHFRW